MNMTCNIPFNYFFILLICVFLNFILIWNSCGFHLFWNRSIRVILPTLIGFIITCSGMSMTIFVIILIVLSLIEICTAIIILTNCVIVNADCPMSAENALIMLYITIMNNILHNIWWYLYLTHHTNSLRFYYWIALLAVLWYFLSFYFFHIFITIIYILSFP